MNAAKATKPGADAEKGSSLILAVFVLVLISALGISLVSLSRTEVKMSRVDLGSKRAFYLSEAGLEDGRATVWDANQGSGLPKSFTDELTSILGPNGDIDFDPANLTATFDAQGNITGLGGFADDLPLRGLTAMGDGWYAAFLTNDPLEGIATKTDGNGQAMVTGVGAGPDGTLEIVQAILKREDLFPALPATITILGPSAEFDGGSSSSKNYNGNDDGAHCLSGDPSLNVPTVGVFGAGSEVSAELGVKKPGTYRSGSETGNATVDDISGSAHPLWSDCQALVDLAAEIRSGADIVGTTLFPNGNLPTAADPKSIYIEGDYGIAGGNVGVGMLLVTGMLVMSGNAGWEGPVFVIGAGEFVRSGAGNGLITGGLIVADVAGPDRTLFTSDDCSGEDGIHGTADDGLASGSYDGNGGGNGTTGYCEPLFGQWQAMKPLEIASFLQR